MRTLKIRSSELWNIKTAVETSIDYHEESDADNAYEKLIGSDFLNNKEAWGHSHSTQHNLLLGDGDKALIYQFDDTSKLSAWLDDVEAFMTEDGIYDAKLMGNDPTRAIQILRDFCAGKDNIDDKIEAYYNVINNL